MSAFSTILSPEEQAELKGHEEVIQDNLFSFVEVGTRLLCIRDKRLWRGHESFDAYLKFRWPTIASFSSRYRRDLAAAAEVVTDIQDYISANENTESGTIVPLSGIVNTLDLEIPLPQNEYQARSMAPIPREARGPVWKDLVQQSGGRAPTGAQVKNAVDEFMGSPGPDVAPTQKELRQNTPVVLPLSEPELLPPDDEEDFPLPDDDPGPKWQSAKVHEVCWHDATDSLTFRVEILWTKRSYPISVAGWLLRKAGVPIPEMSDELSVENMESAS